jgi:hypothetical protein
MADIRWQMLDFGGNGLAFGEMGARYWVMGYR